MTVSHRMIRFAAFVAVLFAIGSPVVGQTTPHKTENILFVMTDGVRWHEVFEGADKTTMVVGNTNAKHADALAAKFWRETPEARREILLPFFWNVVARQGQAYGNRNRQSTAQVTNGLKFSYPGYQEVLCGFPDPRINKNDVGPNPNASVLEWLNGKPAYRGRVAAFGAWNTFNDILNRQRCGFLVNAGLAPLEFAGAPPQVGLLNQLKLELPICVGADPMDALVFHSALEYFRATKPRVLYVALGETDEWGHAGRYDQYLTATQRFDAFVRTLWETAQAMPQYKDKTTLILATDHGRGGGLTDWRDHGEKTKDSEHVWIGFLGPDTPALGERANVAPVGLDQVAATMAALLGEDYRAAVPKAGKPIADVLPPNR